MSYAYSVPKSDLPGLEAVGLNVDPSIAAKLREMKLETGDPVGQITRKIFMRGWRRFVEDGQIADPIRRRPSMVAEGHEPYGSPPPKKEKRHR